MPSRSHWDLTLRQSVEQECRRRGEAEVVAGCIELLAGRDADRSLVYALGGPAAESVLGPHPRRDQRPRLAPRWSSPRPEPDPGSVWARERPRTRANDDER
jgi:hypothetical protein